MCTRACDCARTSATSACTAAAMAGTHGGAAACSAQFWRRARTRLRLPTATAAHAAQQAEEGAAALRVTRARGCCPRSLRVVCALSGRADNCMRTGKSYDVKQRVCVQCGLGVWPSTAKLRVACAWRGSAAVARARATHASHGNARTEGRRTTRPSSSLLASTWQPRRDVCVRPNARSSMSFSSSLGSCAATRAAQRRSSQRPRLQPAQHSGAGKHAPPRAFRRAKYAGSSTMT